MVQLVLDARAELAEGPHWDAERSELVWVDILAGHLHRWDARTGIDHCLPLGEPVGAVARHASRGFVAALASGFAMVDDEGTVTRLSDPEAGRPGMRMNDGKCDSAGRFWAGSMAYAVTPHAGTLYRLDGAREVRPKFRRLTLSNGIGWSPDDTLMYLIDSQSPGGPTLTVFDFDAARGEIDHARVLLRFPDDGIAPDGLAVDAEGFLWIAMFGAGEVRRYAPDGRLDRTIVVPASQPTCCAFGGPEHADLYITTARIGLGAAQLAREPHAGGIFRIRPNVAGLPAHRYRG
jgi:sugar lactone lactonase YvrE